MALHARRPFECPGAWQDLRLAVGLFPDAHDLPYRAAINFDTLKFAREPDQYPECLPGRWVLFMLSTEVDLHASAHAALGAENLK